MSKPDTLSRADAVRDAVVAMAGKLGPSRRMPTRRELGRVLRVSGSTLHPILQELEQQRILILKHGSGIFVAPTIAQKTVGVVFGGNIFGAEFSPFWGLLLEAVRRQAAERAHRPLAHLDIAVSADGLGGHAQLIEDLENRRIHGMLLLAPSDTFDEVRQLAAYGVPLVLIGSGSSHWSVNHDWPTAFSHAARELVSCGCRRIAFLGDADDTQRQLLERDLREAGYGGEPVLDWTYNTWAPRIFGDYNREMFGRELALRMIERRASMPLPDGVVSLDDTMTRGVITALQQAGLQPGCDIHIASTANKGSPVLEPYASDLVLMEYDPAASVRAALDVLETLMNGGTPPLNPVLIAPVLRKAKGGFQ